MSLILGSWIQPSEFYGIHKNSWYGAYRENFYMHILLYVPWKLVRIGKDNSIVNFSGKLFLSALNYKNAMANIWKSIAAIANITSLCPNFNFMLFNYWTYGADLRMLYIFTITCWLYSKIQIFYMISHCLFCTATFDNPEDLHKHRLTCKATLKKRQA